jgi:large subunit ribosomal protein L1
MGKRIDNIKKNLDLNKVYDIPEAVKILKEVSNAKFDESFELHLRLGIDPKKADQTVRSTVVLPKGTGRKVRVAVMAKGEKLMEAQEAGADIAAGVELIEEIKKGNINFDVLIVTPDLMKDIAKIGKILGPKGLMPNPKTGTVTFDIKNAVKEVKAGRIEFRNDSYGIVHVLCGKKSFKDEDIVENVNAVIDAVNRAKPSSSKGQYLRTMHLSTTMGPALKIKQAVKAK